MKTGILTWYDVTNYGSVFQAYALQQYILKSGNDCVILSHDRIIPHVKENKLSAISIKDLLVWLRNQTPNRVINRKRELRKYKNFLSFRQKFLIVGDMYDKEKNLDIVFIGSDQMFDIKYFFYDYQFGNRVNSKMICSYAPSFGENKINDIENSKFYDSILNGLNNMAEISVRDVNSRDIVKKITNKEVPIVLDPTLLYDFKYEKNIWSSRLVKDPYLLIYSWGGSTASKEFNFQLEKFAKKNSLKTVSVGDYRKWCDYNYASAKPIEFFQLFANASMVITNMFHGTCFSILNEKPFYSLTMPHNEHKLGGLLRQFGLENQIITDLSEIGEKKLPKIEYSITNKVIQSFRNSSEEFLNSILNKK